MSFVDKARKELKSNELSTNTYSNRIRTDANNIRNLPALYTIIQIQPRHTTTGCREPDGIESSINTTSIDIFNVEHISTLKVKIAIAEITKP